MKRKLAILLTLAMIFTICLAGCGGEQPAPEPEETPTAPVPGELAYEYLQYLDENLPDRDCISGANYADAQEWIKSTLAEGGYAEDSIKTTDFTFVNEDGDGATVTAQNISVTKDGTSDKQIIIGAHYDGTGTGDNGSGACLALANAVEFANTDTYYDLTFVFFSAEEYGLWGSSAYAEAMTDEEVEATQYEINMDSIMCGDFCYIYGGVADFDNKTVNGTEAYDNALSVATDLGLDIKSNPWTFDNPEPTAKDGVPAYPAPSTGDWSDHVGFYERGIPYLYFEATNWEIGDYDGYEETAEYGPLMNTDKDQLATIEEYFPGRALEHVTTFDTLLKALLVQESLEW